MSRVGQPERVTQNRIIALFRDELGYRYLGNWTDRTDNRNIEEDILGARLAKRGNSKAQISRAIHHPVYGSGQPQPLAVRQHSSCVG